MLVNIFEDVADIVLNIIRGCITTAGFIKTLFSNLYNDIQKSL